MRKKTQSSRWYDRKWVKYLAPVFALVVVFLWLIISAFSNFLWLLPYGFSLVGGPFSERNYLILFQNNTELRPAGGFISAYAVARVRHGIFTGLSVKDVYGEIDQHDYVEPPYPMKKLLDGPFYDGYTFRDANYSPDFPRSAEDVLSFYGKTFPDQKIDGVVAVNFSVLEDLLELYEPIELGEMEFTSNNLFEGLEFSVNDIDKHDLEDLYNRKGVLGLLSKQLVKEMIFGPLKWESLAAKLEDNLKRKEIQVYFRNKSLQEAISDKGWAGELPAGYSGDFLAVVEANLGGMKSDRYLKRDVEYRVYLEEDPFSGEIKPRGQLRLRLTHDGEWNVPLSGDYRGYFRFLIPAGAQITDITENFKDIQVDKVGEFQSVGMIVEVTTGGSEEIVLDYTLPKTILNDDMIYRLHILKQSGTKNDRYRVVVRAPQGMRIQSDDFLEKENFGELDVSLETDAVFDAQVLPDELPPRVVFQKIADLKMVELHFNEPVDGGFATDPLNYQIVDKNVNNAHVTDKVTIRGIEHDGRIVRIFVDGMTFQKEEHYSLMVRSVRDIHGNMIEPVQRSFTLVQRL